VCLNMHVSTLQRVPYHTYHRSLARRLLFLEPSVGKLDSKALQESCELVDYWLMSIHFSEKRTMNVQ
jgi:hypothetical protein